MAEQETGGQGEGTGFTPDLAHVIDVEKKYLADRRDKNELPPIGDDAPLWGLAFSGGGVRSATFCLGVMQALTSSTKGLMKRFDYLSTVSGGGYIGSCLTSLLSDRSETGLDKENFPFTGLGDCDEDTEDQDPPKKPELDVRHQIHHLRTHGEYLIPRSRLLSRDVQRAVGSVLPGTFHTVFLFALLLVACVAAIHLVLTGIEQDLSTLAPTGVLVIEGEKDMGTLEYVKAVPKVWFDDRVEPPFRHLYAAAQGCWKQLLWIVFLGVLWCAGPVALATFLARNFDQVGVPPADKTRAGWTIEDELESRFVWWLNLLSVVVAVGLMIFVSWYYRFPNSPQFGLAALLVPLAFAIGGLWASHALTHVLQSQFARLAWKGKWGIEESRFRRSLYGTLRGASIYGLLAAVAVPIGLVFLFALSVLPFKFFWSLAALAIAYFASRGSDAGALQLGGWLQRPLANIGLVLFLAFGFAEVSALLLGFYREVGTYSVMEWSAMIFVGCAALFVFFAVIVDANRISPHYFYRDRLTEAYLKTDARTERSGLTRQGKPLTVLRDNEDLHLKHLGRGNGRGPYHLIVAALNLTGSQELNRKSFLSEHFIFSRDFIGSRVTGWVPTEKYRKGTTRLARAMTISAAAVGSAMGPNTFVAQAFVTTLFNVRLGYWTENPWEYREKEPTYRWWRLTFWPRYLYYEAFGQSTARRKKVNVSDGGHTGDNVALLPLLQRRCRIIVVCDAEADGDLAFGSFNNAVRMAFTEENIRIDIDLTKVMDRDETPAGYRASSANVVIGKIFYPKNSRHKKPSTGRLIYIKSSIPKKGIPVHVANYAKAHGNFPHQTTADQFFDDEQFEAYRALGENLGGQAVKDLKRFLKKP